MASTSGREEDLDYITPDDVALRFIGVDTPYEAHREDFNTGRLADESRRVSPFVPTCSSQAKETVAIKYYLNSPQLTAPLSRQGSQKGQRLDSARSAGKLNA
ncbi:hypothetical protein GPECTOR_69g400 [Gonium pectorale]|uniref:Uncharacterized protein n=1 Tax=Gonium pectorale TaxID=33097 RepID=A0A150G380_GONPE|nr:hypothetical protein GPECTOR_69g400 [Gonium pectorale]|eukprot:KXZ44307.1 hypothetical protein GPECTOR_69g400 [Gonium pectorale]